MSEPAAAGEEIFPLHRTTYFSLLFKCTCPPPTGPRFRRWSRFDVCSLRTRLKACQLLHGIIWDAILTEDFWHKTTEQIESA